MTEPASYALAQALARLWVQHLPEIQSRVTVLESTAMALSPASNVDTLLLDATSAAHKLAGVLGTFGLPQATELAREAEMLCAAPLVDPVALGNRLGEIASQLRALIATKQ